MNHKPCLNCGHSVYEKYCSNCGQKISTKRLNWSYVFHDIPHSVLHLDKGFFLNIRELTLRPGKAIREYLDGKRTKYFRPIAYLLILGTITGIIYLNNLGPSSLAGNDQTAGIVGKVQHFYAKYYNIFTALMIPVYSFFVWLFYKRERNFVEIITINVFLFAHLNILTLLRLPLVFVQSALLTVVINMISGLVSGFYQVTVYSQVFTSRKRSSRIAIGIFVMLINALVTGLLFIIGTLVYFYFFENVTQFDLEYGY